MRGAGGRGFHMVEYGFDQLRLRLKVNFAGVACLSRMADA